MKNGKYLLVVAPDDYPGKKYRGKYVYEHRLVWWQNTGDVADGFDIHHLNEDPHDNRIENLQSIHHEIHARKHGFSRRRENVELVCPHCLNSFSVRFNQRKRKFCGRKCQYESFKHR